MNTQESLKKLLKVDVIDGVEKKRFARLKLADFGGDKQCFRAYKKRILLVASALNDPDPNRNDVAKTVQATLDFLAVSCGLQKMKADKITVKIIMTAVNNFRTTGGKCELVTSMDKVRNSLERVIYCKLNGIDIKSVFNKATGKFIESVKAENIKLEAEKQALEATANIAKPAA